jgi:ligand-binding sensor domain-containing protein
MPALLVLLAPQPAEALDPAKALTQYSLSSWDADDGLPNDTVQDVAQSADGYLWLATLEGLARFDGARFQVFDRANTPAIPRNDTQVLHVARDGTLWVAVYGGGLLRYRDGRFELLTQHQGLPTESVSAIVEDGQGVLWIGLANGLVALREGHFEPAGELAGEFVFGLHRDPAGAVWAGTRLGLYRRETDGFRSVRFEDGGQRAVRAAATDAEGRLWVGTDAGPFRLEGERLMAVPALASLAPVRDLALDGHGALWIAWERGLSRVRGGRVESLTEREGLPTPVIGVAEDRDGSLWLASSRGVHQLKDGPITSYGPVHGLPGDDVYALAPARDGGLYVGSADGQVHLYAGGRAVRVAGAEQLGRAAVLALTEDRRGRLWVGTDGGLWQLAGRSWTRFGPGDGLSQDPVRSILEDREGTLWVGTEAGGLARLQNGRFAMLTTRDGLPDDQVRGLLEARDGTLWVATYGGLAAYRDGRFRSYTTRDGLSHDLVRALYEDRDGTLWAGTYGGGLNRLKDGRITALTSREGLFSDVVYHILEDDAGRLWMSCNKGIFSIAKREVEAFASGRVRRITSTAYGRGDGMANRECNGGFPGGWRGPDGRLWFPTIEGIAVVDPAERGRASVAAPPLIEEVLLDGVPGDPARPLRLGAGPRRLQVRYTSVSLLAPERVLFAVQLEGFDPGWQDVGTHRRAEYTSLPAGDYRFRVRARLGEGPWREASSALSVHVAERWYRRGSVLALGAVALLAATLAAHRLRLRALIARERELERRVAEALADVKVLRGMLPICAWCKKVRDDRGYWNQIESYLRERSEAEFSHGICPDCLARERESLARLRGSTSSGS